MDYVKSAMGGGDAQGENPNQQEQQNPGGVGGLLGGVGDKLNSMAGGGKASEKDEGVLDKGEFQLHISSLQDGMC